MEISILLDAMLFAAEYHKDQRRKGNDGSPYVNHLIEVTFLLANMANVTDSEVLQAAVLHDVLEDTNATEGDLLKRYGSNVLNYVKYVTDDKKLSLEERRNKQVQTVANARNEIKLIKLADHCSNIASLPSSWELEKLENYLSWSHDVAVQCFIASDSLADEYKKRYEIALSIVDKKRT